MPESLAFAHSFPPPIAASPISTPVLSAPAVHWGLGPIGFELRCRNEEFLSCAARVLSTWPVADNARLVRRYSVEWVEDSDDTYTGWWKVCAANLPGGNLIDVFRGKFQQALASVEYDAVHNLLQYTQHFSSLHSALLSKGEGGQSVGVAIVGPCQAGKSTLACALWNSGWSLQSDDMTFFNADGSAYPSRRRVSLRRGSRELIGEELWSRAVSTPSCDELESGLLFHPHEVDGRTRTNATQLAAIIFLARRGVKMNPAELQRMNPAQAAMALLPYSNLAERLPFPQALARVAALTENVPVYDMGRGPLTQMMAGIDSLVS